MAERSRLFGRRAEEAAAAIDRAVALLDVFRLSKVDVSPAVRLVTQAREALDRKDSDSALAFAARSERLAATLEERYRGAQKALAAIREIENRARAVGLDPSPFLTAIADARRVAREGTVEDGISIANYLQARTILEAALTKGRDLLQRAEAIANDIYTAELALDALKDANGHMDHVEFERVLAGGRSLIERARQDLARGDFETAGGIARKAEAGARRTKLAYQDAIRALADAERSIAELRAQGTSAPGAERLLEQGTLLLRRAKIAEAKDALEQAAREAMRIAADARRAALSVKEAEESLSTVARSGFLPEEAQQSLRDARRALAENRYERAEELVADARRALGKRLELRDRLARTIEETKRKVEQLRAIGTDYANDVEEMVLRAEREFENGDFATSSEDLKIATLLIGPPGDRNPSGKARVA
ncbi:MAG: hypothetical protein E6K10_05250 [Methanobacteriota archaeon]|nr:MAG: hypothetical protein E6K10_05250 [Euryarchaeota archaeon]